MSAGDGLTGPRKECVGRSPPSHFNSQIHMLPSLSSPYPGVHKAAHPQLNWRKLCNLIYAPESNPMRYILCNQTFHQEFGIKNENK